jgi:hypothetical protein
VKGLILMSKEKQKRQSVCNEETKNKLKGAAHALGGRDIKGRQEDDGPARRWIRVEADTAAPQREDPNNDQSPAWECPYCHVWQEPGGIQYRNINPPPWPNCERCHRRVYH